MSEKNKSTVWEIRVTSPHLEHAGVMVETSRIHPSELEETLIAAAIEVVEMAVAALDIPEGEVH